MQIQEATELVYGGLHGQELGNTVIKTVRNTFNSPKVWEWEVYCCRNQDSSTEALSKEITDFHTLSLDARELGFSLMEEITAYQLKLEVYKWLVLTNRWLGGDN